MISRISKVRKRDGRLVAFDERKIADAIYKAGCAVGTDDRFVAEELAGVVTLFLEKRFPGGVPGIEEIQDLVEQVLIETGHARMAKAYILYRERRARARERVRVRGESGVGPQVGNPSKALVSHWTKVRIAEALVREADLDDQVAADVASRVEEKVFHAGVGRINTGVIRSLVEAELFLLGYGDRVGRQALVGLPRYDVDRLLRGDKEAPWRVSGPRDLRRTLADAVLAQYALAEVYSEEVVEAHLDGRLHVLDVGAPCEWLAAAVALPEAGDAEGWIQAAALKTVRLAGLVTRELVLTGLVPPGMNWGDEQVGRGAFSAARRLLGHSALRLIDRRGGRLRVVLDLPALPEGDTGRALVDGLVREHWARFRDGEVAGLPELVLRVAHDRVDTPEGRRMLLPALAAAEETGRLRIVFEREEAPGLASGWFRLASGLLEPGAGIPVGGAVALNVGALAGAAGSESALLEALDSSIGLGVKALRQKRTFLGALQADPAAPLYRVAAGARPQVRGDRGLDLLQLVGVSRAAARLGSDEVARARLAGRLRSYAAVRAAEEGRRVRLEVRIAPDRDGEAARRFDAVERVRGDAAQAPPGAPAAWGGSARPGLDDTEAYALPQGLELPAVEARYEPAAETVELRFARESAPAPEALFDACCLLARDPRVLAVRPVPWPDRSVRPGVADL